jgi:hypothetical protein
MVQTITNLTFSRTQIPDLPCRFGRATGPRCDDAPPARDTADLSPEVLRPAEQPGPPGVRTELVDRLREDIAAGRYRTADKIEAVVERIREELLGG